MHSQKSIEEQNPSSLEVEISSSTEDVSIEKLPTNESVRSSQSKWWRFGLVAGILLLSSIGFGVSRNFVVRGEPEKASEVNILTVKTTSIKAVNSYQVSQTYTGEVAAVRSSELGFERSGEIVKFKVDRGDRVKLGDSIAQLDTRNLSAQRQRLLAQQAQADSVLKELQNGPRKEVIAAARAEVQDLKDQLQLQQIKTSRRESLYKEGAISKEQLDEISFGAAALSNRLLAAESRLNELLAGTRAEKIAAQQAVVKQLEANINDIEVSIAKSTIKAPFSGTIAARNLDEGTVVNAGQSVVRLTEDGKPEVEIGVPVKVASQLTLGSQKQVQIQGKTYSAKVASILPEINPSTRTRTVVLELEQSLGRLIAPGEIARLIIPQTVAKRGYWLPVTALMRAERGLWSVYALGNKSENNILERDILENKTSEKNTYRVERRDIEVLHTDNKRVLVRGSLQPGDRLIVDGTQRIVSGQLVASYEQTITKPNRQSQITNPQP